MSHLIDADALINEIKKETQKVIKQDDKVGSFWLGYIAGLVIKQPTIQPEPQEGHWIDKYPTTYICSECGWLIPDSKVKVFAYCPNCGAKMKGVRQK